MSLLNRIFCRHRGLLSFQRNIYGYEALAVNACSVWQCDRCGKLLYSGRWATDLKGVPYKSGERPYLLRRKCDI